MSDQKEDVFVPSLVPVASLPPAVHFITFADGQHFKCGRLASEATASGWFSTVRGFGPQDFDVDFLKNHGAFINSHPRGYGYWLWKPYFVHRRLEELKDDDILVYCDSGCNINYTPAAAERFRSYLEKVKNHETGILSFQMGHNIERVWSKQDTAIALDCVSAEIMNSGQYIATIIIVRKCATAQRFAAEWFSVAASAQYHHIDDSPSVAPNAADFREHRHDQTIASLLRKKYGSVVLDDREVYAEWIKHVQHDMLPFFAFRLRS